MDSLIFVKFKITLRNQVFASIHIILGTYQGHRAIHDGSRAQPGRGAESTTLLVPLHQGAEDRQQRRTMASKRSREIWREGNRSQAEDRTHKEGRRRWTQIHTQAGCAGLTGNTEIRKRNPLFNTHFFWSWGRAGPWHWECFDFWSLLIRRHFICKFTKLRI